MSHRQDARTASWSRRFVVLALAFAWGTTPCLATESEPEEPRATTSTGAERGLLEQITTFVGGGDPPRSDWSAPGKHPFDDRDVTGSSSSKNIPHLRAVAGLLRSRALEDETEIQRILDAYGGFFERVVDQEDGSSTYTRWIWPPVVVALGFAQTYGRPEVAAAAERWLDSQAIKWSLATGWGREARGHHVAVRRGYTPWRPNTYCALARSATHREPGGPIVWVEYCPNSSFLSLSLAEGRTVDLRQDFERPLLRWIENEFGPIWQRDAALIRDLRAIIAWNRIDDPAALAALDRVLPRIRYVAPQPVWIWRTTREVGVFGEVSFNNGSTDFLRSKVWQSRNGAYRILLEDYPARRNQGGGGRSRWRLDRETWTWTGPIGRSRIWSLDERDWIDAPIDWPTNGRKIYLVRIDAEGAERIELGSGGANRAERPSARTPVQTAP